MQKIEEIIKTPQKGGKDEDKICKIPDVVSVTGASPVVSTSGLDSSCIAWVCPEIIKHI